MFDPVSEARKIAFDCSGKGERVLLISGFPQTRMSWKKIVPLLSPSYQVITADLPSFGDSGTLSVPATTENVAKILHEFVANRCMIRPRFHPRMLPPTCGAMLGTDG
jgi:pimeloyl-ACP methyl ester carboxylesterase